MESANINEHKAEVLKWSMSMQRQKWRQIYSYLLWMLLSALRLNDHRHKTLLRSDLFRYMQRILIIRDLKHFFTGSTVSSVYPVYCHYERGKK